MKCGECNGTGKLETGGDWGKTPPGEVPCWQCSGTGVKPEGYPREDTCEVCGAHVGWVVSPAGEAFALGRCDDHMEHDEEEEPNVEPDPRD